MTATESLLPEIINDFFNKICQKLPLPLSEMSPEVKVEFARFVPCGVTYDEITRDHKIVR